MRIITHKEWIDEGTAKFGNDVMAWRFVCPSCGHIASVQEWKDAGAREGMVAFSCIGRILDGADTAKKAFKKMGGPCNYAGGGLIGLNPVRVILDDFGNTRDTFEFAEQLKDNPND